MMKKIDVPINNFWYKVIALALALLLWFYVMQTQSNISDYSLNVPLEYRNLPESLVVTNEPVQVRVRVQGNGAGGNISSKDVQAFVDLSNVSTGKTEVSVQTVIPNNFQVVSLSPDIVSLDVETEQSKQVPVEVKVDLAASLPKDKRLLDTVVTPAEILVFGAGSRLNEIDRVVVTANITNPQEDYLGTVPVQIFDKNDKLLNQYFRLMPSVVDVLVPIVDEAPTKRVPVSVPTVGTVTSGYHIKRVVANPDIITISGEYDALEKVSLVYTEPVDVNGIGEKLTVRRKLSLPEGITVNGSEDVNVIVEIERLEQEQKQTFSDISILPVNLSEGLVAKITPEKITVSVQGAKDKLSSLKPEDISVRVDLSGLEVGSHQMNIIIQLPEGIQLVEQSDTTATVELIAVDSEE